MELAPIICSFIFAKDTESTNCDAHAVVSLATWLIVHASVRTLYIVCFSVYWAWNYFNKFNASYENLDGDIPRLGVVEDLTGMLSTFLFAWFIIGAVSLSRSPNCEAEDFRLWLMVLLDLILPWVFYVLVAFNYVFESCLPCLYCEIEPV